MLGPTSAVVFDCGAYEAKTAVVAPGASIPAPRALLNALTRGKTDRRVYIADQLLACRDFTGLTFQLPCYKGYAINWDLQTTLWDYMWGPQGININPTDHTLVLTEPVANLPNIQSVVDELIFEDYGFPAYCRAAAPILAGQALFDANQTRLQCHVVVDLGFSFSTVVPLLEGHALPSSIRRIQVGGKVLTNYLKETVSFRQWNMMDETFIVNRVKETCCFVSQDVESDLRLANLPKQSNPILQEYVLPDQTSSKYGYLRTSATPGAPDDQVLVMNNERFMVPELLFHPSDIGINQAGLSDAIVDAIESTAPELHSILYNNIVLVGGVANLPGITDRLQRDLRHLAPAQHNVRVMVTSKPDEGAYRGGAHFARDTNFSKFCVTKQEYDEGGAALCRRRFIFA